ncbi:uncharacterized protein L199_008693 [Kwoniella botswanensis]|uniref:uncharacterized protein n=1 Tax=Kwoniella botswanensis TaxID=1268659 RepID=UPI00315DB7AB
MISTLALLSILTITSASPLSTREEHKSVLLKNKADDTCLYIPPGVLNGGCKAVHTQSCPGGNDPVFLWDINMGKSGAIRSSQLSFNLQADPNDLTNGVNLITAEKPKEGSNLQQWTVMENGTIFYSDHASTEKAQRCLSFFDPEVIISPCMEESNEEASKQIWSIEDP